METDDKPWVDDNFKRRVLWYEQTLEEALEKSSIGEIEEGEDGPD